MSKFNANGNEVFTRYQFPGLGECVTLLTFRQKLGEASVEEGGEQTTHYGWWPNHQLPQGSIDAYIPDIGDTLTIGAPTFWGAPENYTFTLLRVNHGTFRVIKCDPYVSL